MPPVQVVGLHPAAPRLSARRHADPGRSAAQKTRTARPQCETLEERVVPATLTDLYTLNNTLTDQMGGSMIWGSSMKINVSSRAGMRRHCCARAGNRARKSWLKVVATIRACQVSSMS